MDSRVSCGIKTFNREQKLASCLASLVDKGFHAVIVADDGNITPGKREVYETYRKILPMQLITLPFDTGISAGRNAIVDQCTTEYLLMLDDDQIVPENIGDLLLIMEQNTSLGGISGVWNDNGKQRCGATNLFVSGKYVVKDIRQKPKKMSAGKLSYYVYDFIPNSTLFRTECLRQIPWDPFYKIGSEHLDFYLKHQKHGTWKFAITPDVVILHNSKEPTTGYRDMFRKNNARLLASEEYLNSKWNIKGVIEIKRHLNLPGVYIPRLHLVSQLVRMGVNPEKAIKMSKHASKWVLMFFPDK